MQVIKFQEDGTRSKNKYLGYKAGSLITHIVAKVQ